MGKLVVCNHPLIQTKVGMIRNKETGPKEFRELVEEIATLICYEATKELELEQVTVDTPIGPAQCMQIKAKFAIVPILRAGLGMVEGMMQLMPTAKVGHVGMYRDPDTLQPVEYYCKLPVDCEERETFVLDPMLATGGTASAAISFIKDRGVKNIKLICVVSCPDGVKKIQEDHPDIEIFTAAHDTELNSHGYIVPGLGDAGDRLFGTK